MGFFDPPPAEEEPPREEPDWLGPSPGVLGVAVPFAAVLARTGEVALVIAHLTAYPNGFEFRLLLRLRAAGGRADPLFMHPGGGQGADAFHLGVQFADGRKATNVFRPRHGDGPPEQPLLMMRGGGGGPRSWTRASGSGACRRPGRSPSSASGGSAGSPSPGSSSTRSRCSTRPPGPSSSGRTSSSARSCACAVTRTIYLR